MEYITINENKIDINVIELEIINKGLIEIPKEIKELKNLKKLDLSHNKISEIKNIPEGLEVLYLENNHISEIKNLPNSLELLDLDYNLITDIPHNLLKLKKLKKIYLYDNYITVVKNLPNSIIKLGLGDNKISEIKKIPESLKKLDLSNNHITEIKNLPEGLTYLNLKDNEITKIKNLPIELNELQLENNYITKIKNLPQSLKKLDLGYNQITEIKNLPNSLEEFFLQHNQITEIPLTLLELTNLTNFYHIGNPIEHIPPIIQRWIDRIDNGRLTINRQVYDDLQNVHNSNIQASFRNSLQNIIKDKDLLNNDFIKENLINNQILNEESKREILNYFKDDTEHSIYRINYQELFQYVYSRIYKHKNKDDILKILNQDIQDGIGKCFTGRLTRLLNVLVGYYDDIEIQISDKEQITNIIISLKNKYEDEELIEKVKEELTERGYNKETIEEWISYL